MDRREFTAGATAIAVTAAASAPALGQTRAQVKRVRTKTLEIAYEESGPSNGSPVLMLHGFPYDPRAFDDVAPQVAAAGCRAIVPYLRGYGPTRFLDTRTMRSGQQAAMGRDALELMDALQIQTAVLAGYDWGGRAANVVAALYPERVKGLVSANGYTIQDIAASKNPNPPEQEHRAWYQFYFHTERGRAGLTQNRKEFCKLLWTLWSPNWKFDDATYQRSAASFDNPDFVEVVIHSYRHRFGYVAGDPAYEMYERQLAAQPKIKVPTIVLQGEGDGVNTPANPQTVARMFTGKFDRRMIPRIGHNVPQEAPMETARAVIELVKA
jgi:pimeloyl-ACP methyl ester carboxylesterase